MTARIAAVLILSLIALTLCCQMLPFGHVHDDMERAAVPMAHAVILLLTLPLPVVLLIAFALFLTAAAAIPRPVLAPALPISWLRPPDRAYDTSLRTGFSNGVLNPKPF